MHSHIGCICMTFLHCGFWNVSSKRLPEKEAKSHWLHLFNFFHCAFLNVTPNLLPQKRHSHIGYICLTFPLWFIKCFLKWPVWEDAKSHWLHLFSFFLLCVFTCWLKELGSAQAQALVAFVWLFALCVFKCLLKWPVWEDAKSQWLHWCDLMTLSVFNKTQDTMSGGLCPQ